MLIQAIRAVSKQTIESNCLNECNKRNKVMVTKETHTWQEDKPLVARETLCY